MKALEELTWKKPSDKHIKRLTLFIIRCVEIATASVLPSFLGIILVFLNPNRGVMMFMSFVSFIAFVCLNCWFTIRFVRNRASRKEFYALNGLAYAFFIALSILIYFISSDLGYSIIFSNLRLFEAFGASTAKSLVITHSFIVITMIICEIIARIYYRALYKKIAEEQSTKVEMDVWGDVKAVQKDSDVKFLTIDEAYAEMENDRIEAARVIAEKEKSEPDGVWDDAMVKGKGNAVEFTDGDELFDETVDYESFDEYEPEPTAASVYDDYDPDSLWNADIYKGRTKDEKPIYDYDDEPEEMFEVIEASVYKDDDIGDDGETEPLWDAESYRGREKEDSIEALYEPEVEMESDDMEYETNSFEDYDVDNLWGNIVQGRKNDE